MRFSTLSLLALPLLATAQQPESVSEHFKKQANKLLSVLEYVPYPSNDYHFKSLPGSAPVHALTLDNWNHTLHSKSLPGSSEPVEWWILVSGGNKTCYGMCDVIENAYKEAAVEFKDDPTAPNLAYLNCDKQPVLCSSWSAGPPGLWIAEVAPKPAASDIHLVGLNVTSTTASNFTKLHETKSWKEKKLHDGYFQPLDGVLAVNGLATPIGYIFWFMGLFPNWMMMIFISFLSRTFMNRTMGGLAGAPAQPGAAPAGGRVPGAPAGDGVKY